MKGEILLQRQNGIGSGWEYIPNGYWQTKYTGRKRTGLTAGKTA